MTPKLSFSWVRGASTKQTTNSLVKRLGNVERVDLVRLGHDRRLDVSFRHAVLALVYSLWREEASSASARAGIFRDKGALTLSRDAEQKGHGLRVWSRTEVEIRYMCFNPG